MNENIIKKIEDLLKLSKSDNANEAATAYAHAQKLLTKYHLDIAEITNPSNEDLFENKQIETFTNVVAWRQDLFSTISKLNGCFAIIKKTSSGPNSFVLYGKRENIEITEYLYNSIVNQVEELSTRARISKLGSGKTWYNNYKRGIVSTVISRLKESNQEIKSQYVGTTALARVDSELSKVESFVKNLFQVKKTFSSNLNYQPEAFKLGKQDGIKIGLNRGLN